MEPHLRDKKSAANLAAWMANHFQLKRDSQFPDEDTDRISQSGSHTQSTSSWNTIARSYLAFTYIQNNHDDTNDQALETPDIIVPRQHPKNETNESKITIPDDVIPRQSEDSAVMSVNWLPVRAFQTCFNESHLENVDPNKKNITRSNTVNTCSKQPQIQNQFRRWENISRRCSSCPTSNIDCINESGLLQI